MTFFCLDCNVQIFDYMIVFDIKYFLKNKFHACPTCRWHSTKEDWINLERARIYNLIPTRALTSFLYRLTFTVQVYNRDGLHQRNSKIQRYPRHWFREYSTVSMKEPPIFKKTNWSCVIKDIIFVGNHCRALIQSLLFCVFLWQSTSLSITCSLKVRKYKKTVTAQVGTRTRSLARSRLIQSSLIHTLTLSIIELKDWKMIGDFFQG